MYAYLKYLFKGHYIAFSQEVGFLLTLYVLIGDFAVTILHAYSKCLCESVEHYMICLPEVFIQLDTIWYAYFWYSYIETLYYIILRKLTHEILMLRDSYSILT